MIDESDQLPGFVHLHPFLKLDLKALQKKFVAGVVWAPILWV